MMKRIFIVGYNGYQDELYFYVFIANDQLGHAVF